MKLVSTLYKIARIANNVDAVIRPKRLPRRIKNIFLGRFLARLRIW